jgi:hypothetical protein
MINLPFSNQKRSQKALLSDSKKLFYVKLGQRDRIAGAAVNRQALQRFQ